METAPRISILIRLRPELMERVKRRARLEKRSFNSYVEHVLDKETEVEWPKIGPDFKVSEEILALRATSYQRPSQEEIDADPKLAYLMEKFGL